ncbi:DUF4097 domain-containing protein [Thalassotalea euphylliae]|uniref:DUF4097 family beta strand repeat-containing protein n=1 Tax=Thalassotalea euphylliae TaxID=1655234 RepID=UPI00362D6F9E
MKTATKTLATLFVTSFAVSPLVMADEEKVIEKTFDVQQGASFDIDNVNGAINIYKSDNDQIKVIATVSAKSESQLERIKIDMVQNGNKVDVETKYKQSSWGNNNSGDVNYDVWLPDNMSETDVDLVNGSLKIEGVSGELDADLVNGSIDVSELDGDAKLNSVNGSVTARYTSLTAVKDIEIETVNGSIKVFLPSNPDIRVDAETMHGSIKSDFSFDIEKSMFSGRSMTGTVGNGTTSMSLESVNGGIKVFEN